MLEQLDQIDWRQLSHAYGPATDVPEMIRGLATITPENREQVLVEVWSSILHQGSLYTATAAAIPFLIELLNEPSVSEKNHILDLLAGAAESALDVIQEDLACRDGQGDEGIKRPIPSFIPPILTAVEGEWSLYCRLLLDRDAAVRISATLLLRSMVNHRAEVAAALTQAIDTDQNDQSRAVSVLALGLLIERDHRDDAIAQSAIAKIKEVFDEPDSTCAALAAAIAMVRLEIEEAIAGLLERDWPALVTEHEFFVRLPWQEQDWPFAIIALSLKSAPEAQLNWIFKGLAYPDPKVQTAALYAAGDYCRDFDSGPLRLAPEAVRLVDSPDESVRRAAVRSLKYMGELGRECLRPHLCSLKSDVRREAQAAFKQVDFYRRTKARPGTSANLPNWVSTIIKALWRSLGVGQSSD